MIEENLNKLLELLPGLESYNTTVKALEDENKDSKQSVEDSQLSLSPSKEVFVLFSTNVQDYFNTVRCTKRCWRLSDNCLKKCFDFIPYFA